MSFIFNRFRTREVHAFFRELKMNKMMKLIFLGLCLLVNAAKAEVIWEGDSPACDAQSVVSDNLGLTLIQAAFNTLH